MLSNLWDRFRNVVASLKSGEPRRKSGRPDHRRGTVLHAECLEQRQMLSANQISLDTSTSTLLIKGTTGADSAKVWTDTSNVVHVTLDTPTESLSATYARASRRFSSWATRATTASKTRRISIALRPVTRANDVFIGGTGTNYFLGGVGNDQLYGNIAIDSLYGEDGNDLLSVGGGSDRIEGGDGNDQLYGDDGNDTLNGQAGDDYLDGGAGNVPSNAVSVPNITGLVAPNV